MNNFVAITATSTNSTQYLNNVEMTVFSINILFGFPLHSYIVWLIVTGSGIASYFINLSLSICEILYSLNYVIYVLSQTFPDLWVLAQFLIGLGITGRPLFQSLICFERYLAVVHPVAFLKYKPLRYKAICCAAVWVISLGSCFICVFVVDSLSFPRFTCYMFVQFLVFLFIQLFCCMAVLRALKRSGPGERGREREEENHMKKRAFNLILITTVTMIVMFVPYIIAGILIFFKQDILVMWYISMCSFILSGFVHPLICLQRKGKLNCLRFPKNLLVGHFN